MLSKKSRNIIYKRMRHNFLLAVLNIFGGAALLTVILMSWGRPPIALVMLGLVILILNVLVITGMVNSLRRGMRSILNAEYDNLIDQLFK